jgi:hypothetical protein
VKELEVWLNNHHVPYEEEKSASADDANTANLVFWSSELQAQVKDLVAEEHNLRVLYDGEKAKGVASGRTHRLPVQFRRIEDSSTPKHVARMFTLPVQSRRIEAEDPLTPKDRDIRTSRFVPRSRMLLDKKG